MHLLHNITTSDELPFDIELRDSGPVRVFLYSFANLLVSKNINVFVVADPVELEDLHDVVTETAARHLLAAFHKKHDIVVLYPLRELSIQLFFIHRSLLRLSLEVAVTLTILFILIMLVVMIVTSTTSTVRVERSPSSLHCVNALSQESILTGHYEGSQIGLSLRQAALENGSSL